MQEEAKKLEQIALDDKMESNDYDLQTQADELRALGISVVDQYSIEQNVEAAVDKAVASHSRKQKIQMIKREIRDLNLESKSLDNKRASFENRLMGMQRRVTDPRQYLALEKEMKDKIKRQKEILERGAYLHERLVAAEEDEAILDDVDLDLEEGEIVEDNEGADGSVPSTSERARLIEAGEMTPFGTIMKGISVPSKPKVHPNFIVPQQDKQTLLENNKAKPRLQGRDLQNHVAKISTGKEGMFENYLQDQLNKQKKHAQSITKRKRKSGDPTYGFPKKKPKKIKEFIGTALTETVGESDLTPIEPKKKSPLKRKILHPKRHWKEKNLGSKTSHSEADQRKRPGRQLSEVLPLEEGDDQRDSESNYSDYVPEEDEMAEEEVFSDEGENRLPRMFFGGVKSKDSKDSNVAAVARSKRAPDKAKVSSSKVPKTRDDAYVDDYQQRVQTWKRDKLMKRAANPDDLSEDEDEYEEFDGGFKIPLHVWNKLYKYQKIGVKWLWELHNQGCGGILGDEMGLGKTIQVISFLLGLSFSGLTYRDCSFKGLGPVLIVSPATVLHQWVKEFHKWWPPFRVAVLHGSGVFTGKRQALIHNINRFGGILITSYTGMRAQLNTLLQYDWHYLILDEGHKIRNPEAQITVAVKRFQTIHRLVLSGSPIQNSLKELWSLFDFIFPSKLGSLPVFLQQFAVPITQGGYANASKLEVQTAYRCATMLRDTINPYLLRRMKNDVRKHLTLPDKNEQVLFCALTEEQRSIYRQYLDGDHVKNIMRGRLQVFVGLINLRKICNHPDLYTRGPKTSIAGHESGLQPELQYGWWERAGKMAVLHSVLKLWSKQGHRVLLFTQSRQMLCILEKFIQDENYTYFKMDGGTGVSSRQPLIDRFNKDPSIFIFLLTTKVGGLGINLTGADRVIIYDPDWNPSTDSQARERAWRIGQLRHVTIYRLLTSGTIEEKIYHRQIFKQFLTNRILKDPKQQRFFKTNDLYELFTLHEGIKEKNESSALFAGTGSEIKMKTKTKEETGSEKPKGKAGSVKLPATSQNGREEKSKAKEKPTTHDPDAEVKVGESSSREKMLMLAKMLSKKISEEKTSAKEPQKKALTPNCKAKEGTKEERIKRKERHKKGKKFEGERIEFLVKKRKFKDKGDEERNILEEKGNKNQDEYVLKKLFKASGVHTALSHDVIVNTGDPDYLLLESEADRVAKEAMRQVRASRRHCFNPGREPKEPKKPLFGVKKNTLIDTAGDEKPSTASAIVKKVQPKLFNGLFHVSDGESDTESKPSTSKAEAIKAKASFGAAKITSDSDAAGAISSSQLLLRMKQRNQDAIAPSNQEDDSDDDLQSVPSETQEHVDLLTDIRNFVAFQSEVNGKASTQEVIDRFRDRLPKDKTHIFKALLNEICDFRRDSSKVGFWHLKGEFR